MPTISAQREARAPHPTRTGCIAGRAICPRPVVGTWTAMCQHEHFRSGPICQYHQDKADIGKLTCRECLEHPTRPHDYCYVRAVEGLCR